MMPCANQFRSLSLDLNATYSSYASDLNSKGSKIVSSLQMKQIHDEGLFIIIHTQSKTIEYHS